MIMATPKPRRFRAAYDHFFRLSLALRALETCGKPVASAIAGLALGGGGELALASHYRVLTDDRHAAIGLPESLVGLLPGAGGTQRLPRLIGVERAMPMLLEGKRLSGARALEAGVAHAWSSPARRSPPPKRGCSPRPSRCSPGTARTGRPPRRRRSARRSSRSRRTALETSLGHYPAVFAILDCVAVRPAAELRGRHPQRDDELFPSRAAARAARDDPDHVPRPRRLRTARAQA